MDFVPLTIDDFDKWNAYVFQHPDADVFHLAEWSAIYKETYKYIPEYRFLRTNSSIAMILPFIHQKGLFKNIIVSGLSGYLKDDLPEIDTKIVHFVKSLKKQSGARDLIFLKTVPYGYDYPISDENVRLIFNLPSDSETLWHNIGVKQRNMVRKAEKNQLKHFVITPESRDVSSFYRIYSENYRDLGTPVHPEKYFQLQLKLLPDYVRLLFVEYKGKRIGGMWLHHFRDQMSDPEAASLRRYFQTGVSDFMYYKAFEYAVRCCCATFNMGRSQAGSGTYSFKKKWGDIVIEPYAISRMKKFKSIHQKKSSYRHIISLWKHTPVAITNLLGPFIRKHTVLE